MALDNITKRNGDERQYSRIGITGNTQYGHYYLRPLAAKPSTLAAGRYAHVTGTGLIWCDGTNWRSVGANTIV